MATTRGWKEDLDPWGCSQEFHNAGRWIVHLRGPNRPNKFIMASEDYARRLVDLLNDYERRLRVTNSQ